MKLYFYSRNNANFGDCLGPIIVEKLVGCPMATENGFTAEGAKPSTGRNLLALGSIFHLAGPHDVIWGTGINPFRQQTKFRWWDRKIKTLDIRAVRGPLTRRFIIDHWKRDCPEVYGDPALLLPKLVPTANRQPKPKRKVGVIPHYHDLGAVKAEHSISPFRPHDEILTFILESELVVSSSLHGLIVAEAFGVPARWLHSEHLPSFPTEGTFKFNDYYLSTGRDPDDWAPSVDEAARRGGKEGITGFDCENLRSSFPFDLTRELRLPDCA
jgi:pyruvyltransferase